MLLPSPVLPETSASVWWLGKEDKGWREGGLIGPRGTISLSFRAVRHWQGIGVLSVSGYPMCIGNEHMCVIFKMPLEQICAAYKMPTEGQWQELSCSRVYK